MTVERSTPTASANRLGQPFLTETGRLASADQPVPLACHALAPLKGRIGQYTLRRKAGLAAVLHQHSRQPALFWAIFLRLAVTRPRGRTERCRWVGWRNQ
jgi:hypothetical protein